MFDNLKNLIRSKGATPSSPPKKTTAFNTHSSLYNTASMNSGHNNNVSTTTTTVSNNKFSSIEAGSSNNASQYNPNLQQHPHQSQFPEYKELSPRYEFIEKLGEGAFSLVFKAIDHKYKTLVAIKVIDKTSMTRSQIANVSKEITIMRRLDHPNIVKLYDYIDKPKKTFIIIEYISGGELFNQIVKYTYFSENLARHIIIQVVKAVDYLHSEVGVVHRDIKPENILFERIEIFPSQSEPKRRKSDDDSKLDEGEFKPNIGGAGIGKIKLADFGLSKVLWDSNTKTPCGTASYTAPEIVKDEAYSKSVDMWAVGCVFYTLLCGFPPFYDTDPKTLTLKVSKGDYSFLSPWWDEISKEAKDLVSHLLTVDPRKRYGPDEVLNHPWILNISDPTLPASDSPIFKAKSPAVLRFEEIIPSVSSNLIGGYHNLSPRAEALKFAFDAGISVQRTGTPLRRILDNNEYFDESDDEDEDSDDSDDSDDDDSDNDISDDSDNEEDNQDVNLPSEFGNYDVPKGYTYNALNQFSMMKKYQGGLVTPNHCKRRISKGSISPTNHFRQSSATSHSRCRSDTAAAEDTSLADSKDSKSTKLSPGSLNESLLNHNLSGAASNHDLSAGSSSNNLTGGSLGSRPKKKYHFREIDDFNLNMNENTLLNRRKMSGSLACGPVNGPVNGPVDVK